MSIDWNFVIGSVLLVVNSIVGLADFLQGGVAWPCMIIVIGGQVAALTILKV